MEKVFLATVCYEREGRFRGTYNYEKVKIFSSKDLALEWVQSVQEELGYQWSDVKEKKIYSKRYE